MNFDQVKELVKIIDLSTFVDFDIDFENTRMSMSKNDANKKSKISEPVYETQLNPNQEKVNDKINNLEEIFSEPITIIPEQKPIKRDGEIVEAPLVGTFYESASPDNPPFVKVGTVVKKGDVLCIIEAMKIMNEITSKFDGTVTEILVKNEDMVEYGQHMFVIA